MIRILASLLALTLAAPAMAQTAAPPATEPLPAPAETIAPTEAPATTGEVPIGTVVPEGVGDAFDAAKLDSCVAAAADPQDKYACVGSAAEACTLVPGHDNTIGMTDCFGAELDHWKAQLNATYDKLFAIHQQSDKALEGVVGATPQAPVMEAAQKAWLAYRDAECAYQESFWAGGSGGGPAAVACEMTLTGHRAIDLNASLLAAETR